MSIRSRVRLAEAGLVLLCLAGVGLAVYAPSLDGPFVFDDHIHLLRNRAIQLRELSLAGLWSAATESPAHRPVANLSFALNYWWGGSRPRGYHALNLALHVANGLLVYALARAALRRRPLALGDRRLARGVAGLAALLFVVHPLQTQSVSYVVQRMNLLCAFFYLAALACYVLARERAPGTRRIPLAACAASGLLALGSKQNAVTLPLAIFLWEWCFYRDFDPAFARRAWRRAGAPLLLLAALVWWWIFQGPHWGYNAKAFGMLERALTQGRAIALYLSLALLPLPSRLNLLHDLPLSRSLLDPPSTLPALLAVAASAAGAMLLARRVPWLAFGALWFLLHLAVESSILPLDLVYEHRNYLPLAGLCLAASVGAARLARQRALPLVALGLALALPFAVFARQRNRVWADPLALWSDVVAKSPANPLARSDLASALAFAGRSREALAEAERALALAPGSARIHANLGAAYSRLGRWGRAVHHLERAQAAAPDDAELESALGAALLQAGQRERARAHLARAVARDPQSARAAYNVALLARDEGDLAAARAGLERALRLEPEHADAHQALGFLLEESGSLGAALPHYEEALRLAPSASAHARLGWALAQLGRDREARQQLAQGLEKHSGMPLARARLAWLLATSSDAEVRDPRRARGLARRAQRELPAGDPFALEALAAAEAALGNLAEGARLAREALAAARASGDARRADALAELARRYEAGAEAREIPGR